MFPVPIIHSIAVVMNNTTATKNPGVLNLLLTESGRRRNSIGTKLYKRTIGPPESSASIHSKEALNHALFQLARRLPKWKKHNCPASKKNADIVAGVPSIPLPMANIVPQQQRNVTTPARRLRRRAATNDASKLQAPSMVMESKRNAHSMDIPVLLIR